MQLLWLPWKRRRSAAGAIEWYTRLGHGSVGHEYRPSSAVVKLTSMQQQGLWRLVATIRA